MTDEKKTIGHLLNSEGRVKRWPKKKSERLELLKYLASKFESEKEYNEDEVNEILMIWDSASDYATIRREMFINFLLDRTPDGKKYWIMREPNQK